MTIADQAFPKATHKVFLVRFRHRRPSRDWLLDVRIAALIKRKAIELSRHKGFSRSDREDIEQDLRLHLHRMWTRYDPARSEPHTFATRIINNKAASMVRLTCNQKAGAAERICGSINHLLIAMGKAAS